MPEKQESCSVVGHSLQAGCRDVFNSIGYLEGGGREEPGWERPAGGYFSDLPDRNTSQISRVRFYPELTQSRPSLPDLTPPTSPQLWSLLMTGYGLLALLPHCTLYSRLSRPLDLSTSHPHCPRHWIQFKKKTGKKKDNKNQKQKPRAITNNNNNKTKRPSTGHGH